MRSRIARRTITTLAIATALVSATPARADHDRDRDGWRDGRRPVVTVVPAPVIVRPGAYREVPSWYAPSRPAPPMFAAPAWRAAYWRAERELHELRSEYRSLALARDRFYATWDGRPWTRDRFEAWYAARHADLDARAASLERWAR